MRHPTVTLVCRLSRCVLCPTKARVAPANNLCLLLFFQLFTNCFSPPLPSLSSVHRMQPRIAWIRSLVSFMFRSRLLRVVVLNDVCPIFVPLTLSSNFSYVLASCAAHAARASSRTLLLLSLFIRLLRRFTPYQPIFLQCVSTPFHFTLTLPLPSSTQLDLYFILQLRAPCMSALFILSFFSPFLLLLILFSVYPLVHISPLLFSHFSSLRPRYLPVRTLLDRRVLYQPVSSSCYMYMAFSYARTCVDPNRTNNL